MDSPLNVSPTYGVYDKKTSQEAINERREARRQLSTDPATRIASDFAALKRDQDAQGQKIAALESFRAGMNGDENIKVTDNKITWVGRTGLDEGGQGVQVTAIENGQLVYFTAVSTTSPLPF